MGKRLGNPASPWNWKFQGATPLALLGTEEEDKSQENKTNHTNSVFYQYAKIDLSSPKGRRVEGNRRNAEAEAISLYAAKRRPERFGPRACGMPIPPY